MIPTIPILHSCHSSVIVYPHGACLEVRRGYKYNFSIPNPRIWSSVQEWHAESAYIPAERAPPPYWNSEVQWLSQWFSESNLFWNPDTRHWDVGNPSVFVRNAQSGYMIPVFMDLTTGTLYVRDSVVTGLAQAGIDVVEVWRMELGEMYRVL